MQQPYQKESQAGSGCLADPVVGKESRGQASLPQESYRSNVPLKMLPAAQPFPTPRRIRPNSVGKQGVYEDLSLRNRESHTFHRETSGGIRADFT
jgi:hypothetical protein